MKQLIFLLLVSSGVFAQDSIPKGKYLPLTKWSAVHKEKIDSVGVQWLCDEELFDTWDNRGITGIANYHQVRYFKLKNKYHRLVYDIAPGDCKCMRLRYVGWQKEE